MLIEFSFLYQFRCVYETLNVISKSISSHLNQCLPIFYLYLNLKISGHVLFSLFFGQILQSFYHVSGLECMIGEILIANVIAKNVFHSILFETDLQVSSKNLLFHELYFYMAYTNSYIYYYSNPFLLFSRQIQFTAGKR